MGVEPTIFSLGGRRLIHEATEPFVPQATIIPGAKVPITPQNQ